MPSIQEVWLSANQVIRAARQALNKKLRPLGLTSVTGNVLLHVLRSEAAQQEQLAEQLDIDKAAVSRTVSKLEEQGYLRRETALEDKRVYRLLPTQAATALLPALKDAYDKMYRAAIKGVSEEEFAMLLALLRRVSDNLSVEEEDVPC